MFDDIVRRAFAEDLPDITSEAIFDPTDRGSARFLVKGSGVVAGNMILVLFVSLSDEVELSSIWTALLMTFLVMLSVGLLACVAPARRALRIHPTDALKEA